MRAFCDFLTENSKNKLTFARELCYNKLSVEISGCMGGKNDEENHKNSHLHSGILRAVASYGILQ